MATKFVKYNPHFSARFNLAHIFAAMAGHRATIGFGPRANEAENAWRHSGLNDFFLFPFHVLLDFQIPSGYNI